MNHEPEKGKDLQPVAASKKIYSQPTLSEYGSVAKLTRSGGMTVSDHGGNRMARG